MSDNERAAVSAARVMHVPATVTRTAVAVGFGGFLMLMGAASFPLPWTPVPFSMMPFGLLVVGAAQRPGYAALSVAIYLAAGAAGAPVFADGAAGLQHLVGATAGYLWGFAAVSVLVSFYLRRRNTTASVLSSRLAGGLAAAVAAAMVAGGLAIAWMWSSGNGLSQLDAEVGAGWGVGRSSLWVLVFLTAALTATTLWWLRRRRHEAPASVELFLVMLGAIVVLHAAGVTVLWAATDLSLASAVILGSIVFLPFDIVKAGAAVAATLPFLPSPAGRDRHATHSEETP